MTPPSPNKQSEAKHTPTPASSQSSPVPFRNYLVHVERHGWTDGSFRTDGPYGWCHKWALDFPETSNRGVTRFVEMPPSPGGHPAIPEGSNLGGDATMGEADYTKLPMTPPLVPSEPAPRAQTGIPVMAEGLREAIGNCAKRFACWAHPVETEAGHQAHFIKNAEEVLLSAVTPYVDKVTPAERQAHLDALHDELTASREALRVALKENVRFKIALTIGAYPQYSGGETTELLKVVIERQQAAFAALNPPAARATTSDMPKFQREARYSVIKLKTGKPVDCVVVEADWPEYEIVWRMIQDRMEGRLNEHADLKARNAELAKALEGLLASCAVTSKATDAELQDAREKGYAPEIREQAAAILTARTALAAAAKHGEAR